MAKSKPPSGLNVSEARDTYARELWNAEVDYADTLRERRKLIASSLLVIVAAGVINVYLGNGDPTATGTPFPGVWYTIYRGTLTASILVFLAGAWFLYTSHKTIRPLLAASLMCPLYFQISDRPYFRWDGNKVKRRASEKLDLPPEIWDLLSKLPTEVAESWLLESRDTAYRDLHTANRRVSGRLRSGGLCVFLGYFGLVVSFVVYTWGQ